MMYRRRLFGAAAGLGILSAVGLAKSMGRLPIGGRASMRLPYDTSQLDPYDLFDPLSAIVGAAVFEPVYRLDASGNPYASLAASLPERDGNGTVVHLRPGLRSSRGRVLDGADLVHSVERALAGGAGALLAGAGRPSTVRGDGRAVRFAASDPVRLAQALASPLVVLSSRTSTPTMPDGTGPYRATPGAAKFLLQRNEHAARGPALLHEVRIERAADMADAVRAFEARDVDLGWLGPGYYQPRPDAVPFDFGACAWVVLRTGSQAQAWDAPGVAQRLVEGVAPASLSHLGLETYSGSGQPLGWGGPSCSLIVAAASVHLVQIAATLASRLSTSGHEIRVSEIPRAELDRRRAQRAYALMLDVVRPLGPPGLHTLLALATADDPARARALAAHPPQLTNFSPGQLARTMRLGVVGALRAAGATVPDLRLAPMPGGWGWDLGGAYRIP